MGAMNKAWIVLSLFIAGLTQVPLSFSQPSSPSVVSQSNSVRALWVPFRGTVELGLSPYIQRAIRYAETEGYSALILDIDTFGGRVDSAVIIRDALLNTELKTVAWINKRAISAGALVSFACKKIFFSPGSTMGAATPIQVAAGAEAQSADTKVVSYFRAEMGATAERFGRDRKIAEAMVMATENIKGLVNKGDVLTLTDKTAAQAKISDGVFGSRQEVLKALGIQASAVTEFEINWAEKIVRFLTDPTVSGLLMSLGVLGLIMELQAPGFGLPGIISLICFVLFFGAKFLVHLAGLEELLLFFCGVVLLLIEFLLLPGKMIPAALGIVCILAALLLAGVPSQMPLDFSFPDFQGHLNGVTMAFIVSILGLILLYLYMSYNPKNSLLVMDETLAAASSRLKFDIVASKGLAVTDLRPSGKIDCDNRVFDARSEDASLIPAGTEVEIVSRTDYEVIVRKSQRQT